MPKRAKDGDPLASFACPNPDCDLFNRFGAGNLSVAERMGKHRAIRRLYCNHCGHRFSERQGSLMQYTKLSEDTVVRIIKCLGHGCSIEATADICEVDSRTVSRMLAQAGQRAEDFHRLQLERLDRPLEAGEETKLNLNVRTLKHRGPYTAKVAIASNDPAGVRVLVLRFEVPYEFEADPPNLYLGVVRPGQEVRREVRVEAGRGGSAKILYATSSPEGMVGRVVRPQISKDTPAVLEVDVKAPDRPGVYRHVLTMTTSSATQPTVKLPVILSVSTAGSVSPDRLDFGRFAQGQTVKREARVTLPEGTSLKVAVPHPTVLDVEIGSADGKGSVSVAVQAKENIPFGPIAGELRIHLEGGETGQLIVPFVGYVSEAAGPETKNAVSDGRR